MCRLAIYNSDLQVSPAVCRYLVASLHSLCTCLARGLPWRVIDRALRILVSRLFLYWEHPEPSCTNGKLGNLRLFFSNIVADCHPNLLLRTKMNFWLQSFSLDHNNRFHGIKSNDFLTALTSWSSSWRGMVLSLT